jgi:hypothetical protein
MYHLKQQHYLLMVFQPGSSLVADAAQAVEGLQQSIAAVAADAQKLLKSKQQDKETQKGWATSMLADLTELPASVLQQLNDEWQDSLKSLVAYLKQHKLQLQFMPLLQCCTDGKQVMDMMSAVDRFIYDTVPQCHAGPATTVYHDAMQLLCELQQLIRCGRALPGTYVQLCTMLLAADTPALLYIQLQHVRTQLHAICGKVAVNNMNAAAAAAAAAVPASTGLFSAAVLAKLGESLAVSQQCTQPAFSAAPKFNAEPGLSAAAATTAAATTAADNIAAALPEDPFGMDCSEDDCSDGSSSSDNQQSSPPPSDAGEECNSSSSPASSTGEELPAACEELPVVCEAFRQLSDNGPGTPAVVSVPASCASSARPRCSSSSDDMQPAAGSGDNAQPAAGSQQQQQCAGRKGRVLRGVAGCVVRPFRVLLSGLGRTALLCRPRFVY